MCCYTTAAALLFFERKKKKKKPVGVACNRLFIVANILSVPCHVSPFFLALTTSNPSLTTHTRALKHTHAPESLNTHAHSGSRCSLVLRTSFPRYC